MKVVLFIVVVLAVVVSCGEPRFKLHKNISGAQAYFDDVAVDGNGTIFVSYKDFANYNKLSVRAWKDGGWAYVGQPGLTWLDVYHPRIIAAKSNILHAAFLDCGLNNRLTVICYENGMWKTLGRRGISAGTAENISIAEDGNGQIYVAYSDSYFNYKISLKVFRGGEWIDLINPEGSPGGFSGITDGVRLLIGKNNIPYILYVDSTDNYSVKLMRITDNRSDIIRVSSARSEFIDMTIDRHFNLYAIHSEAAGNVLSVIKDDKLAGQVIFNKDKPGEGCCIAMGRDEIPVIAMLDSDDLRLKTYCFRDEVTELKYRADIPGLVSYLNITHDNNNDIYIVFRDHSRDERAGLLELKF